MNRFIVNILICLGFGLFILGTLWSDGQLTLGGILALAAIATWEFYILPKFIQPRKPAKPRRFPINR